MKRPKLPFLVLISLVARTFSAAIWHVDLASPQDGPGTNWATAFHTIQDGVDAAASNDTVWVTNGVYSAGGTLWSQHSNRVAILAPVSVRSVNGPFYTAIAGAADPATDDGTGPSALRCVYMDNGATIEGFTLMNGHTSGSSSIGEDRVNGGGVCLINGSVSNCVFNNNAASNVGGGAYVGTNGFLTSCLIYSNAAGEGGGLAVEHGQATHCLIHSNTALAGGGAGVFGTGQLSDCIISNNFTSGLGGGLEAIGGILTDCRIVDNVSSNQGGGIYAQGWSSTDSIINRCLIKDNYADRLGGGAQIIGTVVLNNCILTGNTAGLAGGGINFNDGLINHCTLCGNHPYGMTATLSDWHGSETGSAMNSIIISNGVWNHDIDMGIIWCTNCCTWPMPVGAGNINIDPRVISMENPRLHPDSPCIDTGTNLLGCSVDFNLLPRPLDGNNDGIARPDMGAYEFLHDTADSDGDGLPDTDEVSLYGSSPVLINTDGDPSSDYEEFIADTDMLNRNDWFRITNYRENAVYFDSSGARIYTLSRCTNLVEGLWNKVVGQVGIKGTGEEMRLIDHATPHPAGFYRIDVEVP